MDGVHAAARGAPRGLGGPVGARPAQGSRGKVRPLHRESALVSDHDSYARACGAQSRPGCRLRCRHRHRTMFVLPAGARDHDRFRAGVLDCAVGADPDGLAVDSAAARVLGLSHGAAGRYHPPPGAQYFDDPANSCPRIAGGDGGGLYHRWICATGDGRRFRHRHHRLPDSGDDQLPRHHQGRDPHRRSRGAVHSRRHPRQADGDRRRSVGGSHRRQGRPAAQARARRGERVFRVDGRRLQVRARRRDRFHHHPRRQHLRRHRDRRDPPWHGDFDSERRLHQVVGRRRSGFADSRAHHLSRRRPAGRQGRNPRFDREGGVRTAQPLSDRVVHGGVPAADSRGGARPAVPALRSCSAEPWRSSA